MLANKLSRVGPKLSLATIVVLGIVLHTLDGKRAPVAAAQPEPAKGQGKVRRFDSTQSFLVFQNMGDHIQPRFLGMTPTVDKMGIVVPDDNNWYVVPTGPGFANALGVTAVPKQGNPGVRINPLNPGLPGLKLKPGMPGLRLQDAIRQLQQQQLEALKQLQGGVGGMPGALGIGGLGGLGGMPGALGIGGLGGVGGMPGALGIGGLGGLQRTNGPLPKPPVKPAPEPPAKPAEPNPNKTQAGTAGATFVAAEDDNFAPLVVAQIIIPRIPPIKINPPKIGGGIKNGGVKPAPGPGKRAAITDDQVQELVAELRKQNVPGASIENVDFKDAHLAILTSYGGLKSLVLRNTSVTDQGLINLTKLTELRTLTLDGHAFTGKGLVHLKDLPLHSLTLSGRGINNQALEPLADLKDLKVLRLRWTKVNDDGIKALVDMKNLQGLETIELLGQDFSDKSLLHLPAFKALTTVRLYLTRVTDAGLVHLGKIANLTALTIDCCSDGLVIPVGSTKNGTFSVTGVPISTFAVSYHATGYIGNNADIALTTSGGHINVPAGKISNDGLEQLKDLRSLKELEISNWNITDGGVANLEKLTALTRLKLDSPNVTNRSLTFFKDMANLETLDLRCSSITGKGAVNLRGLLRLRTVYVALSCTEQDLAAYRELVPAAARVSRGDPYEELNEILGKAALGK